jgi:hypothetical protein
MPRPIILNLNKPFVNEYIKEEECYIPDQFKEEAIKGGVQGIFKYVKCVDKNKLVKKEPTKFNVYGMSQERIVPTGMPYPFESRVEKVLKDAKIIIPNGMNMTIIKQTHNKDDSKNLAIVIKDADNKNDAQLIVTKGIEGRIDQLGGGSDGYYKKYLKYKNKYIRLRNNSLETSS